MMVPHYAYMKAKMPGPKGIITVAREYKKSQDCAASSSRLAESLVIAQEIWLHDKRVAMASEKPSMPTDPYKAEAGASFQPAKETKLIPLEPDHPERFVVMGTGPDSK